MSLASGLIYRLEGPTGISNQAGTGNDATAVAGATASDSDGRLALFTDGVADQFTIPLAVIPAVFPYTLMFWSKSAGEARISWNRNSVLNRYIWYRGGTVGTNAGRLTNRHAATLNETIATTNTATTNTWVHNCFIVNSATSRRVILNGDWANSVTSTADTGQGTAANQVGGLAINAFQIGASTISDGTTFFHQLTDSLRIYNRAVTQEENELAASERGAVDPPTALPTSRRRREVSGASL